MADTLYKSKIRPLLGWVSLIAVAWFFVIQPILIVGFSVMGITIVPLLMSDNALIALLGVTSIQWLSRAVEKIKGV